MSHPIIKKTRVEQMRRKGFSVNEISEALRISKSTINTWCREIVLSPLELKRFEKRSKIKNQAVIENLANQKRIYRMQKTAKLRKQGIRRVGKPTSRDRFIAGLALYWGEGYKNTSLELGFTNSDPLMVTFFIHWLKEQYAIPSDRLILRISLNQTHAKRLSEVESYWTRITEIPLDQFTKPSLIKTASKKTFSNPQEHIGTLRIKVRRGTELWREIIGAIEALKL